jgi:hypothetical protein
LFFIVLEKWGDPQQDPHSYRDQILVRLLHRLKIPNRPSSTVWVMVATVRPSSYSSFVPAMHHRLCLFLSSHKIVLTEAEAPSKTQVFLCFHITQTLDCRLLFCVPFQKREHLNNIKTSFSL